MNFPKHFLVAFASSLRSLPRQNDHLSSFPFDSPLPDGIYSTSLPLASSWDAAISPESILGKLNPDTPDWLRTIAWTDFRLAVAFFVVSPLVLLAWSAVECRPQKEANTLTADSVLRVITGYWQASALLLITVLWNIEASPIGVVTGAVAQGMIYISLNWWESLNQQASSGSEPLSQTFKLWRTIASWVAGVGVAVQLPFLRCAFDPTTAANLASDPYCAAWLEPPATAANLLGISPEQVELLAMATLAIYVGYLLYYVAIPLREIGRDGRRPRSSFTWIDPLVALRFLKDTI